MIEDCGDLKIFLPSATIFVYAVRMPSRTGILLLVSGPSGSGKTTLCRRLADEQEAHYSTSCTTRPPRPGEIDGRDYFFLTHEGFAEKVSRGEFLEHATVHKNSYGTLASEVLQYIERGIDVVMDIDVQGAAQVRSCQHPQIRAALVDLFVMPATNRELEARLTGRNTDSAEVIALRLQNAIEEMSHWHEYQYRLLSSTREEDYLRFKALLLAERLRVSRLISENPPS
jgi:guanylate kinase